MKFSLFFRSFPFEFGMQSANVENVSPQISRLVMREMLEISKNAPEGIKVQHNEADFTDIQAVIDGPGLCLFFLRFSLKLELTNALFHFNVLQLAHHMRADFSG